MPTPVLEKADGMIDMTSFPEELKQALAGFDKDGNGLDINELKHASEKWQASVGARDSFDMSAFPESLQATLGAFDHDGDGTVNKAELASAAKMYADSKKNVKFLRRAVAGLVIFILLLLVAIGAMMFMIIDMTKETSTGTNGVMISKNGGNPVQTGRLAVALPLGILPRLPIEVHEKMEKITLLDYYGRLLHRTVRGLDQISDTAMDIHTTMGDVIHIRTATDGSIHLGRKVGPSKIFTLEDRSGPLPGTNISLPLWLQGGSDVTMPEADVIDFSLCTACTHCAAVDIVLDDTTEPIVTKYWEEVDKLWATGGNPVKACKDKLVKGNNVSNSRRLASTTSDLGCADDEPLVCTGNAYAQLVEEVLVLLENGYAATCWDDAKGITLNLRGWLKYIRLIAQQMGIEFGMEDVVCDYFGYLKVLKQTSWSDICAAVVSKDFMPNVYTKLGELQERLVAMAGDRMASQARRLSSMGALDAMQCGTSIRESCMSISDYSPELAVESMIQTVSQLSALAIEYMVSSLSPGLLEVLNSFRCTIESPDFRRALTSTLELLSKLDWTVYTQLMNMLMPHVCTCEYDAVQIAVLLQAPGSYQAELCNPPPDSYLTYGYGVA
eukprot:TRINITY_DN61103_c0_g1_i1.p1 TRINITY_DN61103_c0_g1~~TRINITY_DN61103_c0_g1_i1.p1  ORF type:complete len:612 (-),score=124.38 TRINITY_DN61103_c0_g1_i1:155-1990(-)